jgi:hypothetical protein
VVFHYVLGGVICVVDCNFGSALLKQVQSAWKPFGNLVRNVGGGLISHVSETRPYCMIVVELVIQKTSKVTRPCAPPPGLRWPGDRAAPARQGHRHHPPPRKSAESIAAFSTPEATRTYRTKIKGLS